MYAPYATHVMHGMCLEVGSVMCTHHSIMMLPAYQWQFMHSAAMYMGSTWM